jgi:methyltransferase family protein
MEQHMAAAIRRPSRDYQPLHDVIFGLWGYPAVLVAHDLKVFSLLAKAPRTLPEICAALQITPRPARALLAVCTSLGLVQVREGRYALTSLSEDYLLDSSPTYFGGMFDMMIANNPVWSFESVKKAVLTDTAQVYGGGREMFPDFSGPQSQ